MRTCRFNAWLSGSVNGTVSERSPTPRSWFGLRMVILALTGIACASVNAASFTSPSGYLQVEAYRLVRAVSRNGAGEVLLTGQVEALADCDGVTLVFDVFGRADDTLGRVRLTHGPLYRHDVWPLDRGKLLPSAGMDLESVVKGAESVAVREADCTRGG